MIKRLLKWVFEKTGIHLIKRTKYKGSTTFSINNLQYEVITPSANYAPWKEDHEFMDIYLEVKKNTLVDIYRCYELWNLTEQIFRLNPNASFIEVGVWRGGTAAVIAKKLSTLQANVDFYLADTFQGVQKSSEKDTFYFNGEHKDTSKEIVEKIISGKYTNCKILKGIFPNETSNSISTDKIFGFCHIDVDVYDSAKGIVDWIWDKLIIGGIIIFDDYGFHTCDGVTKFVNEIKIHKNNLSLYNLNGHAILIKLG